MEQSDECLLIAPKAGKRAVIHFQPEQTDRKINIYTLYILSAVFSNAVSFFKCRLPRKEYIMYSVK